MMRRNRAAWRLGWAAAVAVALAAAAFAPAADEELPRAVATLKAVDREGKSNDAAGPAWKTLVGKGAAALLPTLEAIDDANPVAANWLRAAAGAIAEAEIKAKRPLPADTLEAFAKNTTFAPSARRLAYELLTAQDPAAKDRLLPGFLNDPSADLRRDAIAAELDRVPNPAAAKPRLEQLFAYTRDKDQVEDVAKRLADAGVKVSVTEHFAFVTRWHVVGPFESEKGQALTLAYPPEKRADLKAAYKGKDAADVAWKPCDTTDKYGLVDLNKFLGKNMNAAAYAHAVIAAEKETPCEIRVASPNAVQIFLNGTKLFEREEYHHGSALDHHVGKGTLRAGENEILLKVCQNNQKDSWAQDWKFQARVCDATGGPIPGLSQAGPGKAPLGFIPAPAANTEEKK